MSLLTEDLGKIIQDAIRDPLTDPMTLVRKISAGGIDPVTGKAPPPTEVTFTIRGNVGSFSAQQRANSLIEANSVRIMILADSLDGEPEYGDQVTPSVGVFAGRTFEVREPAAGGFGITTTAANATWVMQGMS